MQSCCICIWTKIISKITLSQSVGYIKRQPDQGLYHGSFFYLFWQNNHLPSAMHGQLDSTSAFSKGMMAAPTTKATCRGQRPNSHKSESGKHHLATLFITRALERVLTPAEVLLHLFFNTERVMVLQLVLTSQKLSLLIMTKNYCLRKYK